MERKAHEATGRSPLKSLLSEMMDELPSGANFFEAGHAPCIVFNPWFTKLAWVYNLPYPAGKPEGWGFPGGRADPGDKSIEVTARREASEEMGVGSEDLVILWTVRDGYVFDWRKELYYRRSLFICTTKAPGNPNTQARAEDSQLQTREFRWFSSDSIPHIPRFAANGERVIRDKKLAFENVYYKHEQTLLEPEVLRAIREIKKHFGDDLAKIAQTDAWQRVAHHHLSRP